MDYSLVPDDADITSKAITGTVGKGVTGVRLAIDGVVKKTGKVNTDGTFSIATDDFITQGSTVEVIGYNSSSEVVRKKVKVSNNAEPLVLGTNDALAEQMATTTLTKLGGNYIIGTAPKGTETITIYENGVAVRTMSISAMTTNLDGSFAFKAYVTSSATSVQALAKNSDKLMTSDLSTPFIK